MKRLLLALLVLSSIARAEDFVFPAQLQPDEISIDGRSTKFPGSNNAIYDQKLKDILTQLADKSSNSSKAINVKAWPYLAKGQGGNDTARIQRAIDDACNSTKQVFIPPGDYGTTDNLNIWCSGFKLFGVGPSSQIRILTPWMNPDALGTIAGVINIRHADNGVLNLGIPIYNVEVSDLGIVGTGNSHYLPPTDTGDPKGIVAYNASRVDILRNSFTNMGREILWMYGTSYAAHQDWLIEHNYFQRTDNLTENPGATVELGMENSTIRDNTFVGGYVAIGVDGNRLNVHANKVRYPALACIGVSDSGGGEENDIDGNYCLIRNSSVHAPVYGIAVSSDSSNTRVRNNNFIVEHVDGGQGAKVVNINSTNGTTIVSNNYVRVPGQIGMTAYNAELNIPGTATVIFTENRANQTTENTSQSRRAYGCFSNHASANLTCHYATNFCSGYTETNLGGADGYALDASGIGPLKVSVTDNIWPGGSIRMRNTQFNQDAGYSGRPFSLYSLPDGGTATP